MARALSVALPLQRFLDPLGLSLPEAGTPDLMLSRLASLGQAESGDLSFYSAARHRDQARRTRASAVLVSEALATDLPETVFAVLVPDPYAAFAAVSRWFAARVDAERGPAFAPGIHPRAIVSPKARLGQGIHIGPGAVIGEGVEIGDAACVGAGVMLARGARVGVSTTLRAGVILEEDCEIGDHGLVHSGTVIGADGFGFARVQGRWEKIPQLGRVIIGHHVEIGANCCIDRGALEDTIIGDGCKLDNLIQIGHNVRIGENTALAGCVGVAGSAVIGARCMIGGSAGILGHLEICDDVVVSAMSLVTRSITRPGFYSGVFPLLDNADWEKAAAALKRLPDLRERLRALERLSARDGFRTTGTTT